MRVLDLTMAMDGRTPVFPGDPAPQFARLRSIGKEGADVKALAFSSHFGTHIDAPCHMIAGAKTLSDFPIDTFVGDAIVIDARGQAVIDSDLAGVREGDIVLFCTNHTKKMHDADFFKGNPVLSESVARRLVKARVRIVGLDSFTPDNAPYPVHKILLGNDIMIVENLVGLEELIGKRFQCCVLPLKIDRGDGAPCRVIGIL